MNPQAIEEKEALESYMIPDKETSRFNRVNKPLHYNVSGIECIEAIRATLGPKGFQAYCKGNVMKYLWRYEYKNGIEDLRKAEVYLSWMIKSIEDNTT
jgi:hypothetical protein